MIEQWQRCTKIINAMGSLSGIHTWKLGSEDVDGEKVNIVRCHRCGMYPPFEHRGRLLEEQEDFAAQESELRRQRTLDTRNRRGS